MIRAAIVIVLVGCAYANCPAGYFCRGDSQKKCTPGHYCPAGSDSMKNCPPGTLHNIYGAKSLAECQACPPGFYCQSSGIKRPTGVCYGGYYCIGNSRNPNPSDGITGNICPAGHYCPQGSPMPTLCPTGAYCPQKTVLPKYCGSGHYCPLGSTRPVPCPRGTYLDRTGGASKQDCMQCKPGYACTTLGLTNPNLICSTGYYCTVGSTTTKPTGPPEGGLCSIGHYCTIGSSIPIPCPEGMYQNNVGGKVCYNCPKGRTCTGGIIQRD